MGKFLKTMEKQIIEVTSVSVEERTKMQNIY